MKEFLLEIVTPEKTEISKKVLSVTLSGSLGEFQVLYNHAPLISRLDIGKIAVVDENGNKSFYAGSSGVAEVMNNKVLVLIDSVEPVDLIDLDRAVKAKERAEKRLREKSDESIDTARAESALRRALNRIKLSEVHKSH